MSRYILKLTITYPSNKKDEFIYNISSKVEAEARANQLYLALLYNVKHHAAFSVSRENWFYFDSKNILELKEDHFKGKMIGSNTLYYFEKQDNKTCYVFELFEYTMFI